MLAPTWFQDRHVETGQIGDFLKDDGLRLMTVVGRGGVGKTAMVCRLLKALEGGQLPDDGGPLAVDGIVYLSPVGAHTVSFPNLFADLTRLLPDEVAKRLEQLYQDPQQTTKDQMLALLEAFPDGRTVRAAGQLRGRGRPATEPFAITDAALDEALQHGADRTPARGQGHPHHPGRAGKPAAGAAGPPATPQPGRGAWSRRMPRTSCGRWTPTGRSA